MLAVVYLQNGVETVSKVYFFFTRVQDLFFSLKYVACFCIFTLLLLLLLLTLRLIVSCYLVTYYYYYYYYYYHYDYLQFKRICYLAT